MNDLVAVYDVWSKFQKANSPSFDSFWALFQVQNQIGCLVVCPSGGWTTVSAGPQQQFCPYHCQTFSMGGIVSSFHVIQCLGSVPDWLQGSFFCYKTHFSTLPQASVSMMSLSSRFRKAKLGMFVTLFFICLSPPIWFCLARKTAARPFLVLL